MAKDPVTAGTSTNPSRGTPPSTMGRPITSAPRWVRTGPRLSTMRVQARGEMFRIVQWQVLEQEGERIVNWFGIDNVVTVDDKHDRVQTLV